MGCKGILEGKERRKKRKMDGWKEGRREGIKKDEFYWVSRDWT